jgi:hypothetical protein
MVFVLFLFCAGGIVETVCQLQILRLVVYALVILKAITFNDLNYCSLELCV